MSTFSLLVCDDSSMARKQLLRALPAAWPVTVSQACHGQEALDLLRTQHFDLLLLDLTMPVLDGYGVLAAIRAEGLQCPVIVVSGDVQDEAMRRVTELGALAFLKKPAEPALLEETLQRLGFLDIAGVAQAQTEITEPKVTFRDAFREVINVAMGRAAALLARVLGVFVQLPVPNVNILEVGELHMALMDAQQGDRLTAVCQGYIGVVSVVRRYCCFMTRKWLTWPALWGARNMTTSQWKCFWTCPAWSLVPASVVLPSRST